MGGYHMHGERGKWGAVMKWTALIDSEFTESNNLDLQRRVKRLLAQLASLVKATIDRYKKACLDPPSSGSVSQANAQFYQQEAAKLRQQISNLQNQNRQFYMNIMGESLGNMPAKDLKNLETKLEKGISRIRSRKNELLFAEIEYMQKRIAENERAQQHMSLMPGSSGLDLVPPHQLFDARNYQHVNDLQPNNSYSCQDQTPLQLV
ncbi:hypothetical protein L1987_63202 [Smallanthus sonchifolius]|uniref:Uncharacterized protein n=1 Tax=Smallanthus sonchifolius TaxID=185202 RepID=A0ACB9CCM7_9ASTR|nr:hypothetical protein L1987_63202 [Smallanthus sonchifolius]